MYLVVLFFVKQKPAYEVRIGAWSSDVCSSDLVDRQAQYMPLARADFCHHVEQLGLARAIGEPVVTHERIEHLPADRMFVHQRAHGVGERRSDERRVGKECVSKGRARWWPCQKQTTNLRTCK